MDPLQLQPPWLTPQHPRDGRYVLGPLLGKGGMGEVVEAWDVILCRTVALKLLPKVDPNAMVRFMTEAQLQARIIHPNICRIYDVEASDATLRIAMQLVRGPHLSQAAKDLSMAEIVAIIAQVAEAVNVAHLMKLIHRDIKPSNILLDTGPDGRMTPCLCDFGLAISLAEPALSITQGLVGTPAFMAPEQLRGDRGRIGPATDVYALGGTLHYLLLGHPPSHVRSRSGRAPRPGLPRDLQKVMEKCLEPAPDDRYPSAGALADDLRRYLNGEPVLAQPLGAMARLLGQARRHGRVLALGGAAALLLAGPGTMLLRRHLDGLRAGEAAILRSRAEEAEWERDLTYQQALPGHDMRPVYRGARERQERIRAELARLGPSFQGPGHALIGRIHLQLGEFAQAAQELETARRLGARAGFRGQEPALARVLASWAAGGAQTTAPADSLQADIGRMLDPDPAPLADALAAFAGRKFRRAALAAGTYHKLHPWHRESALLEAACLCALAGERLEAGAPGEAEAQLQEALLQLQACLGPDGGGASDPVMHHAYFLTARRLGEIQLGMGTLPEAFLKDLEERSDRASRLDPDQTALLEDWLDLRVLAVRRLGDAGLDRFSDLDPAMVFLGTRMPAAPSPGLQEARMALYWQLAEQQLAQGQDASFTLSEALRDSERPPLARCAELGAVLNCKARQEALQGRDPRPTLERALGLLEPTPRPGPRWPVNDTAADTWLIRAEWEQRHGVDPQPSLQQVAERIEWGLRACPSDPHANALQGLLWAAQIRAAPARKPALLPMAQARLRQSRGWLAQRLRRSMEGL